MHTQGSTTEPSLCKEVYPAVYELKLIDTLEKWEELSADWNDLLAESRSDTVFLTWEWLSSWAECYLTADRSLFVIAVYNNDKLVGIAPWYLHHGMYAGFSFRTIRFLGTPEAGSDYLDVFSKSGKEREVAYALYDFLNKKGAPSWDSLFLQDMPSHSLFYLHFHNKIEEAGKFSETTPGAFCPIVSLPESGEEYFSQISSNRRQQFNRHRKLFKTDGSAELHTRSNEQAALADFFSIYRKKNCDNNDMLNVLLNKFSEKSGGRKWVEVDLLSLNGKSAAGLVHLRYNDELSMYLVGVDREFNTKISVGNILVGLCIDRAISQGVRTYDFLKGDEPYKFHWATGGRRSLNLFFPRRKISSMFVVVNKFLRLTAKALLR